MTCFQTAKHKVDIIVPTYNYAHYLDDCLRSLQDQMFTDFRVLIIDNASEDNTAEVVKRWLEIDDRFVYERNERNLGLRGSAKKAYAMTNAEYFVFMSADDIVEPCFLELCVAALEQHPKCSFAYGSWHIFVDDPAAPNHGQKINVFVPRRQSGVYDESNVLLAHNWISNSFTLLRRKMVDLVGGMVSANLHHVGDWHLWMRLLTQGPCYYIHEPVGRYRYHSCSESSRLMSDERSAFDHMHFYDIIFESVLWSWPIRLLAKANEHRWLTGEPLSLIVREMGGEKAEPLMRDFVNRHRDNLYVGAAECILFYTSVPNYLDSHENGLELLREVLDRQPNHPNARAVLAAYQAISDTEKTTSRRVACDNRILVYSGDDRAWACAQIRLLQPFTQLEGEFKLLWGVKPQAGGGCYSDLSLLTQADIVVLQRYYVVEHHKECIDTIFNTGLPVVIEMDDLLFDLPPDNPHYHAAEANRNYILSVIDRADAVIVSTHALANSVHEAARPKRIYVLPNVIEPSLLQCQPASNNGAIRIGITGTPTHRADLAIVDKALDKVCRKYGHKVQVIFMGDTPDHWRKHPAVTSVEFVIDYLLYVKALPNLKFDFALAPLQDNPFNRCKSSIKWLEYSAAGVAGIYSNLPPYEVVQHDQTGLKVANTTEAWFLSMCDLIDHPEKRIRIAKAAQCEVLANWSVQARAKEYAKVYREIMVNHGSATQSASPEVLTNRQHTLTAFEKELAGQQHYIAWFTCHRWSGQSAKRLKELSSQWSIIPIINILIIITDQNQQTLLASTINSLKEQTIDSYKLTVLMNRGSDHSQLPDSTLVNWVETDFSNDARQLLMGVDIDSQSDWLLVCEPGTCFEPVFCNLVGELINRHLEWRFIYTDEDMIDDSGDFSSPSLKPDSNLDLLYSAGYIGHSCLIHSDLWRKIPIDERINSNLLVNYAAALHCHEIFGEKAVGHIDEVIFHKPAYLTDDLDNFEENGKKILKKHFSRQSISAQISPGLIKGSFFVDYRLFRTPLISIIIPIKNRLDLLQACVQSLLKKTHYPSYEVIIMDNHSDDPETLKYLDYLPSFDQRVKVIPYPQEYNYSAINNLAARRAQGEFLVLLNNDTVILQENWLERLVAIGLRQNVGVVGCCLVYVDQKVQHAGVIIGLGGVAEHIGIGLSMNEAGHMGRAQLTQNFSAVTAACLLVRKSLFIEVGGLDEKDFAVLYNDVDLCLKIIERGYRIVWTPFATVVHHANSSLNANPDPKRNEINLRSRKNFIKKWMHRLGNDPAYNRHLSLRDRAWMIDGDFDVPWHPDLEPLPRIVAQPPDTTGVGQYRMIGPLKALTDSGRICSFLLPPINSEARFLPFPSELARAKPTVLFLQNAFSHWHIGEVEMYAELLPDIFRVFGQDDIVFSVPQKSSVHKLFGKDTKARLRKVASLCHRVIATSQPIADAMRGMVDDIRVMPNYLERSRWGDLQPPRKERRKLRVGWAGAQQHQGDLEFIIPVVEATANEVDWIFMGMSLTKLRYHIAELHGPVSFDEYPAGLAALDLDLAIAPLEINRFNAAKSNLRLLEYGAVGYPVICTDIEPYRNAPVTRVPNNPQAWIDAIRAHVHDMDATRAAGEQLHDWVLSDWMLDQHLDEWMKMLLPD